MRIIIVDDHLGIRLGLDTLLQTEGHQTQAVNCGDEALEVLSKTPADLILLDLHTEGMSAYDFVRELKRRFTGVAMPVLGVVSGLQEVEIEARRLGADFWVKKPFDPSELLDRIGRVDALACA